MSIGLFLLICVAGGLGAVGRWALDTGVSAWVRARRPASVFPWGIALVNVLGSFLLGVLTGALTGDPLLVLGVGLLGGFTTFSTASVDAVRLLLARKWGRALGAAIGVLALALIAATLGLCLGSAL